MMFAVGMIGTRQSPIFRASSMRYGILECGFFDSRYAASLKSWCIEVDKEAVVFWCLDALLWGDHDMATFFLPEFPRLSVTVTLLEFR